MAGSDQIVIDLHARPTNMTAGAARRPEQQLLRRIESELVKLLPARKQFPPGAKMFAAPIRGGAMAAFAADALGHSLGLSKARRPVGYCAGCMTMETLNV